MLWVGILAWLQPGCSPGIAITLPDVDAALPLVCSNALETDCDEGPALLCYDLDADEAHCGNCERACGVSEVCAGGECCGGAVCGAACLGDRFVVEEATGPSECIGAVLHDLDGDGFDDAIYPCQLGESIEVYWGNSAGALGTPLSIPSGRVSPHLALGDVDEDGHEDMLSSLQGMGPPYTDRIRVFFGGPARTFPRQADIFFGGNPRAMLLAHVDDDAHLDLLIDQPGVADPCMVMLPGNGNGVFDTSEPSCVWNIPASPDDNANMRLLSREAGVTRVARTSNDGLWMLEVSEFGVLRSAVRKTFPSMDRVAHVSVVEADGDSTPDMIVTGHAAAGGPTVVIVRNQADLETCAFDSGFAPDAPAGPLWIMGAGDYNGDGLIDMVGRASCCEQPTSTLGLYIRQWSDTFD